MQTSLGQEAPPAGERFGGYERQTARKAAIRWLMQGEWVKQTGFDPSYVVTPIGEKVSRCRVLATVVSVFVAEDNGFASVTLDDGTDTIRAKAFAPKEGEERSPMIETLKKLVPGQLVDVVAKVREYNGELYLIPEAVAHITDPNLELLRRLELAAKGPVLVAAPAPADDAARKKILEALAAKKDGMTYPELIDLVGSEDAAERAITELLEEGACYEPTPGKIRRI